MVLESLITLKNRQLYGMHHLYVRVFLLAVISSLVGMWFAYTLFPEHSSVLWIALVTVAAMPFMVAFFQQEEMEYATETGLGNFFTRNIGIISVFFALFLGVIVTSSLVYSFAPEELRNALFDEQLDSLQGIQALNTEITGQATGAGGKPCSSYEECVFLILENNAWVLVLILIASFLYGAGAIFEISWNASIIGVFAGVRVSELLATVYGAGGEVLAYGHGLYYLLGFLPHGIFEIAGFSLAAIAGSIVSAGVAKGAGAHELGEVVKDAVLLTVLGLACVAIGAFIEATALIA